MNKLDMTVTIPVVPAWVQTYLDANSNHQTDHIGDWEVAVTERTEHRAEYQMGYLNRLVLKRHGAVVHDTGWLDWYGEGRYKREHLIIMHPKILEAAAESVTLGYRSRNIIHIMRYDATGYREVLAFDNTVHKRCVEQFEASGTALTSIEQATKFLKARCDERSNLSLFHTYANDTIGLFDRTHVEGDYGPVTDRYAFIVWVKDVGLYESEEFQSGFSSAGAWGSVSMDVKIEPTLVQLGRFECRVVVREHISVMNQYNGMWSDRTGRRNEHTLAVEWEGSLTEFEKRAGQAMTEAFKGAFSSPLPVYQSPRIVEYMIDVKRMIATWILFEQIDSDRGSEDGNGWLGDQFRYSLWMMRGEKTPVRLYEDHAYLRPHSRSGLTGTRGRDCSLKKLRLESDNIIVSHPEGERVEEQVWKELSFPIG